MINTITEYNILMILKENNITSNCDALPVSKIREILSNENFDAVTLTIRKNLKQLKEKGLVEYGLKHRKGNTFYITKKGILELENIKKQ